jgi:hypothetical protein
MSANTCDDVQRDKKYEMCFCKQDTRAVSLSARIRQELWNSASANRRQGLLCVYASRGPWPLTEDKGCELCVCKGLRPVCLQIGTSSVPHYQPVRSHSA